jgi:hypothetical protein
MKALFIIGMALILRPDVRACGEPSAPSSVPAAQPSSIPAGVMSGGTVAERRADKRFGEMLDKMQAAVEETAQLYGNPVFLQVFTNDPEQASILKQRLKAARTGEDIRRELADLEKKREDLLSEIALREKEVTRLSGRLVRQRAALDALAAAVEQARNAVEETAKR